MFLKAMRGRSYCGAYHATTRDPDRNVNIGSRLVLIVIHFNPVAIGILEVDLPHSIRTGGNFAIPFEVAIFHLHLVEVSHKVRQRCHPESGVNVNVMPGCFRSASNYVQLLVRAAAKPDMPAVFERVGDSFEADHLFVELDTLRQVTHKHRGVIQFGSDCRRRLRKKPRTRQKERQGEEEGNRDFSHSFSDGWESYKRPLRSERSKLVRDGSLVKIQRLI